MKEIIAIMFEQQELCGKRIKLDYRRLGMYLPRGAVVFGFVMSVDGGYELIATPPYSMTSEEVETLFRDIVENDKIWG